MSFFSRFLGGFGVNHEGITANDNEPPPPPGTVSEPSWNPGDPNGVEFEPSEVEARSFGAVLPSPWSGWPAEWNVPSWDFGSKFNELVDIAWTCLDLNASVLSTMPLYRTRNGQVADALPWMSNPDTRLYASWNEFAKQLFWDYMTGEAFVLATDFYSDGTPSRFRVMPPWSVNVELQGGQRVYNIGAADVTNEILHIRYKSSTDCARGIGPLESAGGRMLTAGVLASYVRDLARTGGVPDYTLETDEELSTDDAQDLMHQWVASRVANAPSPPVLDRNVQLKTHMSMSPKDMAMLEVSQFTEARIAVLIGVPPFLVGLPAAGDSLTYSNVSSLFDFHDRASLRPKATSVMAALTNWVLPRGHALELNRDEYSRPAFNERVEAYERLVGMGVMSVDEVRQMERLTGEAPTTAPSALTGGAANE